MALTGKKKAKKNSKKRSAVEVAPSLTVGAVRWTRKRRVAFELYVAQVQAFLGLSHWVVEVDWSAHPEGVWAQIERWPNQNRATLTVGAEFLGSSAADQRNTVVHELVHCLLFDVHDVGCRIAEELKPQSSRLACAVLDDEVERATDRLTAVLEAGVEVPVLGVKKK